MNNCAKIALSGMMTAMSVVLMFLTGVIPSSTYALPLLAGALILIVVIELGNRWAWMVYMSISILSLFLAPDKAAVLVFILLFGYYPIVKVYIEKRIRPIIIQIAIKMIVFNVSMFIIYYLSIKLLSISKSSFNFFGIYLPFLFLILGNIVLLMCDYALSGFIVKYKNSLSDSFNKILHL